MSRIKITPENVRMVSAKMSTARAQMEVVDGKAKDAGNLIKDGTRYSIFTNMDGKISSLNKKIKTLTDHLNGSIQFLNYAADTFEDLDRYLLAGNINNAKRLAVSIHSTTTDLDSWNKHAPDAEYALLSSIWSSVSNSDNPKEEFLKELIKRTPENDPLRFVDPDYITVENGKDGFAAIVIKDNKGNATVVFAGTNGSGDGLTDIAHLGGLPSSQTVQAETLIKNLSKDCKNITVTGHSLGGYLATEVTLHNPNISKCVALDPPGHYGTMGRFKVPFTDIYAIPKNENEWKIQTYVTQGVVHRFGGRQLGNVHDIDVKWQPTNDNGDFAIDRAAGHNIDDIYNVMGGENKLKSTWNDYNFSESVISYTEVPKDTVIS